MFTGLVETQTKVLGLERNEREAKLVLQRPDIALSEDDIGMSYAVDGTCLTLTRFTAETMEFDLISATLDKTRLGGLQVGDAVNFEQSAKIGDRNGGHVLSGHVDTTARVLSVTLFDTSRQIRFSLEQSLMRYLFAQGFVAVNGASLTVADLNKDQGWFEVWIIPETANVTNIGSLNAGDQVNIEFDRHTQTVVDSITFAVQSYLNTKGPRDIAELLQDLSKDGLLSHQKED